MQVFEIDREQCTGCMECLTHCPSNAISIGAEGILVDAQRCVSCGSCFRRCPHKAIHRTSQVEQVKEFIKVGRKVILSVDPACMAFFPPNVTMEKLAAAAQKLGFWDVADAAEASAAVATEYARLASEGERENLIFSACPVVQNIMEQYYPELIGYLAPVASPMIAHGRMLKQGFTSAAVVHVCTCGARAEEARDVRHSTEINAVLSIGQLLGWMEQEGIHPQDCDEEPLLSDEGGVGELSAIAGGMMECFRYIAPDCQKKPIVVAGLHNCRMLLEELKKGELKDCIIEMNACDGGCVGGTDGVRPDSRGQGRFAATLAVRDYVAEHGKEPCFNVTGVAMANPTIDFSVEPYAPSEEDIREMLCHIGVGNSRQQKDCGKCGYASCRQRAEAILLHKEPVSICRQVVKDTRQDVYSVLYENMPVAAMLVDETQKIVDFNQEAGSLFSMQKGQEKYIFEIMDPGDVQYVLGTGLAIRGRRIDIPELFLRVEASLMPLKSLGMVLGLFQDVTQEETEEEAQQQSRLQSVEMAQKVIDKQMMVAQQIAYLLGETTAETKVTLNQLKTRIMGGEEEKS